VRVEKMKDHQMVLHVVTTTAAQQELISTLLGLPEIVASNVKLEVHVSP
jgi:hypothetical protein